MNTVLSIKGLSKSYEQNQILNDISFDIKEKEFVAIMGRSGSGKSTLLYTMSGMDKVTSGNVYFKGQDLASLKDDEISQIRLTSMGFIFQHAHLLKKLSILDNIVLPAYKANLKSREETLNDAKILMEKTGIADVSSHDIKKVSGGQLQRAAICRALINHPEILFGDEPTGALNSSATKEVMDIINQIHHEGTTIVLVTHDTKVALRAMRIIFLLDGKIEDELKLGNYYEDNNHMLREQKLNAWLDKLNF